MTVLDESVYARAMYRHDPRYSYYAVPQAYASVTATTICSFLKPLCPYIWMIALAGGGIGVYGVVRKKSGMMIAGGGVAIAAILIGKYCCGNIALPVAPPLDTRTKPQDKAQGKPQSKPTNKPSNQPSKPQAKPQGADTQAKGGSILDSITNFFKPLTDAIKGIKIQDPLRIGVMEPALVAPATYAR